MTITPLPTPPSRNDPEATFVSRANDFLGALPAFATQANALGAQVNADKEATETAAAIAPVALAAANFAGNWSDLTGAISVPASVFHAGAFWTLAEDLADVTAKEPGVDAEWIELPGEPDVSWNYAFSAKTDTASTTSSSFTDTGLAVSITPRFDNSKILLLASLSVGYFRAATPGHGAGFLFTNSDNSPLLRGDSAGSRERVSYITAPSDSRTMSNVSAMAIVDAVNTSARTYKLRWFAFAGTNIFLNRSSTDTNSSDFSRAASTMFALEIFQ